MLASDVEEQPVLTVTVRKVTPSEHKHFFLVLSLVNLTLGLFVLFVQIPYHVFTLPGKTIMDLDSSDLLCGVLLVAIGIICWAQRKNYIVAPVKRGVYFALANVAVAFGITLVVIHLASIVTHQTYKNAFICHGDYQANTTAMSFQIKGSIYSKEVFCRYLNHLYLFDSEMIACGVAVIVVEGITAMIMY